MITINSSDRLGTIEINGENVEISSVRFDLVDVTYSGSIVQVSYNSTALSDHEYMIDGKKFRDVQSISIELHHVIERSKLNDSNSIGLGLALENGKLEVKIDPKEDNEITVTKDGLFASTTVIENRINNEIIRAEEAEASLSDRITDTNRGLATTNANLTEVRALAEGATKGIVFENTEQFNAWLSGTYTRPDGLIPADLIVGQDLYTEALDEPDYWWTGTDYQILRTETVDFTDYVRT